MTEFLWAWLDAVAAMVADSAPFLLFGLALAGLVHAWLKPARVFRWLGRDDWRSVAIASAAGVPMPLCSCSVLPVAMSLKESGASKGATTSFLISTPETGVDSISITWALMNPVMTVARPLAALVTAMGCGGLVNLMARRGWDRAPVAAPAAAAPGCCDDTCGSAPDLATGPGWRGGLRYAFGPLLDDLAPWLLLGFLLSGALAAALPADFFDHYLTGGWATYLVMLAVGLPWYVCASASTPVAAALVAKGLAPGAALVLLLAGPATNPATMAVVRRILGGRVLAVYLAAIAGFALLAGWSLDLVYAGSGLAQTPATTTSTAPASPVAVGAGLVLLILMGLSLWRAMGGPIAATGSGQDRTDI